MANTYSQIYIQAVFVVKGRRSLISKGIKEELHKYATGILQNRKHKLLAINFMPDHAHIFFGYKPSQPLPDLMRDIKSVTSKYINENKLIEGKFEWQEGYGAFSYSKSHIDRVIKYVNNQEEHHKKTKFKEEYLAFLKEYEIDYDERYLFDWVL